MRLRGLCSCVVRRVPSWAELAGVVALGHMVPLPLGKLGYGEQTGYRGENHMKKST